MKRFITILALLLAVSPAFAQTGGKKSYVIGFYNLENLFDTYHDEGKNDYEYLPDGANEWTDFKYQKKLANMARVIRAMRDENKAYHAVLGVSEIENRHVLEDLVAEPAIADANYQIVHYDGPDRRGVDVALFYRPELFTVLESKSIPFNFDSELDFVLMHEILHVVLQHCMRTGKRDNFMFNIACDIVVNSNIMKSNNDDVKSITLHEFGESMHTAPDGKEGSEYSAEQVYDMFKLPPSSALRERSRCRP